LRSLFEGIDSVEKINPAKIIRDHILTLKNYDSHRYSMGDFIIFLILPIGIAGGLAYCIPKSDKNPNEILDKDVVGILITSLSIFAALLFNLLLLVYDIVKKANPDEPFAVLKTRFLKEIYANVSYSIFVSMLAVIILLISLLGTSNDLIRIAATFLIYFLVANFILTLLMILRRVHILLSKEFEKVS
jgi:hypothetical protein